MLGLGFGDTVPDANTVWNFREGLTRARFVGKPAIEVLFERFNAALTAAGLLTMSDRCLDCHRTETAQHGWREARNQGKPHPDAMGAEPSCA